MFCFRGFLNCIAKDGTVYDTTKYGWLQGRQIWTYCKLYTSFERLRIPEILDAAIKGNLKNYKSNLDYSPGFESIPAGMQVWCAETSGDSCEIPGYLDHKLNTWVYFFGGSALDEMVGL